MAFKPVVKQTLSTVIEVCAYNPDVTNITITNLSGETCYISTDPDVAASGSQQGEPIYNNGRFEANGTNGRDPRLARYAIGTVGGTIIVGMEYYKADPIQLLMEEIRRQNELITTALRALIPQV